MRPKEDYPSETENMEAETGIIVHASYQTVGKGTRIFLVGRLFNGDTFAVVEDRFKPGFFIRESDSSSAKRMLSDSATIEQTDYTTIDGERCARLEFGDNNALQSASDKLAVYGIRTYEADIRVYDQFLLEHEIYGIIRISGERSAGSWVDHVYINPELNAVRTSGETGDESIWSIPELSICSLDIENDPDTGEIWSVALCTSDPWKGDSEEALLNNGAGGGATGETNNASIGGSAGREWISTVRNERELLETLNTRVRTLDPDLITGWNVIEFDFQMLAKRYERSNVPFLLGRSRDTGSYLYGGRGRSNAVVLPGRQVIDGMRIMRSSPLRFEDHTLDTVARELLGEGKVHLSGSSLSSDEIRMLKSLYKNDKIRFCEYNVQDARLVLEILETSGMLGLTIRRSLLTGISIGRAWTSVAAFEHLYIGAMKQRGMVAPTHGVDAQPVGNAPGGAIIPPRPGLYDNVLVFDFKSLYPSIMRTFEIDPIAFIPPEALDTTSTEELIEAPNGAVFKRDCGLLPEILERFFYHREKAKQSGDTSAAYVYKIIMNSFYGVLGTGGCRFAATDIAGAITGFGHHFLSWCKKELEHLGYNVLYGDTDSVFVLTGPNEDEAQPQTTARNSTESDAGTGETKSEYVSIDELLRIGAELSKTLNSRLGEYIEKNWNVESKLELEFEYLYTKFFLPALRGIHSSSGARDLDVAALQGRAKGYAGWRYVGPAPSANRNSESEPDGSNETAAEKSMMLDIKGMEAARRDWTDAAKHLQMDLLLMLFREYDRKAIENLICRRIDELRSGALDHQLVYRKALRKPVESYARSKPPHVRAALLLEPEDRHGLVDYVWTLEGPEPTAKQSHAIDYDHYIEKQFGPIVNGIGDVLGTDLTALFNNDPQQELF